MTDLLWLPPPEKHLSATYRAFRGPGDRNRASHKIQNIRLESQCRNYQPRNPANV